MDKYPNGIDTPPPAEKAALYAKTNELLNSDQTRLFRVDERDDGTEVYAIVLEIESNPEGDLRREGYDVVEVTRREQYVKRGTTHPEKTTVSAYKWRSGEQAVEFELYSNDGETEIILRQTPKGMSIPDDLSPPGPITKEQGLELRAILMGLEKEV